MTPSPTGAALPGAFQVAVNGAGLSQGVYTGTVEVHLAGAANSPVMIPVTMTIPAVAAPAISAVVNAASYAAATIAPGQITTLFGSNLGPTTLTSGIAANGSLSTAVLGSQVTFDGTPGQILYARNDQIGVVAPSALNGKAQTAVQVSFAGQTSTAVTKTIAPTLPGIFTLNAAGSGQAAIINQNGTVNGSAAPASKGSIIAIYLTGAGATDAKQAITAPVVVTIGGQTATIVPGYLLKMMVVE